MRLHILADLHLEFGPVDIPPANSDVVVLAGDVHVGTKGRKWIESQFSGKPVIYVLGNHEFYHHELPALTDQLRQETEGSGIFLLENRAINLGGYTFLGCTLWTDFALRSNPQAAMDAAASMMNDYHIVRFSRAGRPLQPSDTLQIHRESLAWLQTELAQHDPERTIVVTHHAPSSRSEAPYYANSPLNPAFASALDQMIERSGIPLWIHGHTHYNVDYRLGSTRVVANQRGYPQEISSGFDPGFVIEL